MQRMLYQVNNLPLFQNKTYATQAEALSCPVGNITLVQDMITGLVFNAEFNPDLLVYDSDYQNEQAFSLVFQQHLNDVATILHKYVRGMQLLEVGCGKGYFLNFLRNQGFDVKGVDPAYEGSEQGIIKAYFSSDLGIEAGAVILRHVLEHVINPIDFLHKIANANGNQGLMYIEVPCFDWICQHNAWFDIFYEHVNYFRKLDFQRIFGHVLECGHLFGGQYLYAVVDLATLRKPKMSIHDTFNFPSNFLSVVTHCAKSIKQNKKPSIVWGAASKGVVFSIYMQRNDGTIDMVVDINPAKQQKYLAVSGLLVYPPQKAMQEKLIGATVFIMNSNYSNEIVTQSNYKFNYIEVDKHEF